MQLPEWLLLDVSVGLVTQCDLMDNFVAAVASSCQELFSVTASKEEWQWSRSNWVAHQILKCSTAFIEIAVEMIQAVKVFKKI